MLFSITVSGMFSAGTASICALDILLNAISVVLVPSKVSSLVVFNDSNISSCYDLKSLEWDDKTTLVLSNTRELDGVLSTK